MNHKLNESLLAELKRSQESHRRRIANLFKFGHFDKCIIAESIADVLDKAIKDIERLDGHGL
jgi:hypothetical protein